jgi:choline dehydrogenase-like flavoprotein
MPSAPAGPTRLGHVLSNLASAPERRDYDAIVVGSGISGGWAAKELCERGLETLLLERGRNVEHVRDYPTAYRHPWEFEFRLNQSAAARAESPIQSRAADEGNRHFFVSDREHPYVQGTEFFWIRGYQVGGRSLVWGRQCYRLSDLDFEANAREGIAVDWPIRYADLAPWYDYVERFIGVSGQAEGLQHLPDGVFQPPMEMTCVEQEFARRMRERLGRPVTIGRAANLTRAVGGRGPCRTRRLCSRGCPVAGYFSSNSATLPAAAATGRLTLRPHAVVNQVIYDGRTGRAAGVRIIDDLSGEVLEYRARIVFLNASTIGTTAILLRSESPSFPQGLGNGTGLVGRYLMDHHFRVGAVGTFEGYGDRYYRGRRPNIIYVPRFRNLDPARPEGGYLRGFSCEGDGHRMTWRDQLRSGSEFGADFKAALTEPGPWTLSLSACGECLPYAGNRVTLDRERSDRWGLPLVRVDFTFGDNERVMRRDMRASAVEMLEAAGFTRIRSFEAKPIGGDCMHEMGTARMGSDPRTSVLNRFNQMHEVPNVFITDGSCMTSSPCQNPSLTYMALTARACAYAVEELRAGRL